MSRPRCGAVPALLAALTTTAAAGACSRGSAHASRTAQDTARARAPVAPPAALALESVPPVPAAAMTPAQRRGQALYEGLCWTCHGLYGHGDGPAARGFPDPLPDIGRLATTSQIGQIVARMRVPHARSGPDATAPGSHTLPPETLRLAVTYLATMSPRGAQGNPAAGRLLYATYCVQCHGVRGAGDGRSAGAFAPRPADLRVLRLEGREAQILASISAGGSRDHGAYMPTWGRAFSGPELWDLVAYLAVLHERR